MEGFIDYESRPITRSAYKVKANDAIRALGDASFAIKIAQKEVTFKAHETVFPGDFIVHNTDSDVYHCRQAVFHERNIV